MVLCSAPPPAHYSSSQKVYQTSSTTTLTGQQTAQQQSTAPVIQQQHAQDTKGKRLFPYPRSHKIYQISSTIWGRCSISIALHQ